MERGREQETPESDCAQSPRSTGSSNGKYASSPAGVGDTGSVSSIACATAPPEPCVSLYTHTHTHCKNMYYTHTHTHTNCININYTHTHTQHEGICALAYVIAYRPYARGHRVSRR